MGEKFKKKPAILFGSIMMVSSITALIVLVLFWPQKNPHSMVKITVESGSSLKEISTLLHEKNIISNKRMFRWAVQIMGKEKEIPVGTFSLVNVRSNYDIIEQLVYGAPEVKKVRLLEGWNLNQMAGHLGDAMDFDSSEVIQLAQDTKFLMKQGINASSLEGYLFPDTYLFFDGDTPRSVLTHLVSQYKKFWKKAFRDRAKKLNLTEHEVVTLASIIEGEALYDKERPKISSVYHNRLNQGMKLQADPTIQYIIPDGPRRLLNRDLRIKSPYNTYLNRGLPPGPINSPGKQSLLAALYPEENDFLYFVAKGDGYHTFTTNEKDHNRAKSKLQKLRRELRRKQKNK